MSQARANTDFRVTIAPPSAAVPWILATVLAKLLDVVTTIIGQYAGLREVNPVVRAAMGQWGIIPGMLLTSVISVSVAVCGIEMVVWGTKRAAERTPHELPNGTPLALRALGYGLVIAELARVGIGNALLLS